MTRPIATTWSLASSTTSQAAQPPATAAWAWSSRLGVRPALRRSVTYAAPDGRYLRRNGAASRGPDGRAATSGATVSAAGSTGSTVQSGWPGIGGVVVP